MKKLLIFLIIWLGSVFMLMAVQAKPLKNNTTITKYLSKIPAFTGFWQIKLSKSFQGLSTIGYKKEIFDPQKGNYIFEYKLALNSKNLAIPFETSAKGQILFDQNQIKQIQILLGNQFLLEGDIETGQKLRLTLTHIGNPNPIFSKIRDLEKFQFNIFLPYILPYMNLKAGKIYSFKTIDLQAINKDQIKSITVQVIPRSSTFYQLKYSDFAVNLFYNKQKQLIAYKMPFLEGILITDPDKQIEIEKKILAIKPQQNGTSFKDDQTKNKTKTPSKSLTQKETKFKTEINTGAITQLLRTGNSKSTTIQQNQTELKTQSTDPFSNLKNLNLEQQVKNLIRKKQRKTCPLVIK